MNKGFLTGVGLALGAASAALFGYTVKKSVDARMDRAEERRKEYLRRMDENPEGLAKEKIEEILDMDVKVETILSALTNETNLANEVYTKVIDRAIVKVASIKDIIGPLVALHKNNSKFLKEELERLYKDASSEEEELMYKRFRLKLISKEINKITEEERRKDLREYERRQNISKRSRIEREMEREFRRYRAHI
jgi:activator of 2-hydroxyglutaryl-CoA dehydratase